MDQLTQNLRAIVGNDGILHQPDELLVYECDGLPFHKYRPRAVVFPQSTEQTAEVMRLLVRHKVPFTPRGAGTGLSGGALALNSGVVIELARMRRILEIDEKNRTARVQTGVVNLHVSRAVAHLGLHYIPDPSSQPTCTIGGNIAENAGGIHCLKYGTTTDHVLSARVVLAGGEVVELTSGELGARGYDLLGVFIGSEGTFGIATEATLRLTPLPPAVRTLLADFIDVDNASQAVSAIIAAGVMPAALEMMDREIIRAIEASIFAAGLPPDADAALLIELDGLEAGLDDQAEQVKRICLEHGARSCRLARDDNERKKLWAARKGAFGAVGRIAPDSMIQDAVVPRSRLPEVLRQSYAIASKYKLVLANVFHAGDGNLHPLICFDSRSAEEVSRVKEAGRELMEVCVRAGGSITGEHGVGFDKRDYLPLIFSEADMNAMLRVRAAFDPTGLLNPGKIVPMLRGCGEGRAVSLTAMESNGNKTDSMASTTVAALAIEANDRTAKVKIRFDVESAGIQIADLIGESNLTQREDSTLELTPGSAEEISEIIKLAASEGWTVQPAGNGEWLKRSRSDLLISTVRLNRILDHEPADLIASAQAGVTLTELNSQLSLKGQCLPLDPPGGPSATLGGIVATGLAGPQAYGYGPARRHVIGMRVVLADGSIIKAGGRVVKNVAGYDLCKLFTASYGTLGVITELNFKLRPRPEREATVIVSGSLEALKIVNEQIEAARLFPVAAEIVSEELATSVGFEGTRVLLIRFAGAVGTVAFQVKSASDLAEASLERIAGKTPAVTATALPAVYVRWDDVELWLRLSQSAPDLSYNTFALDNSDEPLPGLNRRIKQQLDPDGLFVC